MCNVPQGFHVNMSFCLTLKQECHHFDEIFIIGCTGSCHYDNCHCSQWWKFHQNYNIPASVYSSGKLLKCVYLNKSPNVDFSEEIIANEMGAEISHPDPCCLSACDVLLFYSVFILEKSMLLHKVVLLILDMDPPLYNAIKGIDIFFNLCDMANYFKIHFILETY